MCPPTGHPGQSVLYGNSPTHWSIDHSKQNHHNHNHVDYNHNHHNRGASHNHATQNNDNDGSGVKHNDTGTRCAQHNDNHTREQQYYDNPVELDETQPFPEGDEGSEQARKTGNPGVLSYDHVCGIDY